MQVYLPLDGTKQIGIALVSDPQKIIRNRNICSDFGTFLPKSDEFLSGVNILAFPIIIIMEKLLENWPLGKSFKEIPTHWSGHNFPGVCNCGKSPTLFPGKCFLRTRNRGNFIKKSGIQEILVRFSLGYADGEIFQKLFTEKCFAEPGMGRIPNKIFK